MLNNSTVLRKIELCWSFFFCEFCKTFKNTFFKLHLRFIRFSTKILRNSQENNCEGVSFQIKLKIQNISRRLFLYLDLLKIYFGFCFIKSIFTFLYLCVFDFIYLKTFLAARRLRPNRNILYIL